MSAPTRGTSFPPRVGPDGAIAWSSGDDNLRECVRVILMTDKNERMMLPEFGANLGRFLFAENTASTHRLIEEAVVQSVGRWEPRVLVQDVHVESSRQQPDLAVVTVHYLSLETGATDRVAIEVQLAR